mmetsp:Transcript_110000/g.218504  ORF Transcript_110000/g.218504 Transcript_110000/m.218504 type:complete len:86 (+) Transcript_110000:145-402(+)
MNSALGEAACPTWSSLLTRRYKKQAPERLGSRSQFKANLLGSKDEPYIHSRGYTLLREELAAGHCKSMRPAARSTIYSKACSDHV